MKVKVWNRNTFPFKQVIKEVEYKIPAQSFIEIEYDDASMLVKSFSPIVLGSDDMPTQQSKKMLEIDADDVRKFREFSQNKAKGGNYLCQACGYVCANKWELKGHIMSEHQHQFDDRDSAIDGFTEDEDEEKKGRPNVRKKVQ